MEAPNGYGSARGSLASIECVVPRGVPDAAIPEAAAAIARMVTASLKGITQAAIEQALEQEHAILQELLAPIVEKLASASSKSRRASQASDEDGDVSEVLKVRRSHAVAGAGQGGGTTNRLFRKQSTGHREQTSPQKKISVSSSRRSRSSSMHMEQHVEDLQKILDGEFLELAALVPSSKSFGSKSDKTLSEHLGPQCSWPASAVTACTRGAYAWPHSNSGLGTSASPDEPGSSAAPSSSLPRRDTPQVDVDQAGVGAARARGSPSCDSPRSCCRRGPSGIDVDLTVVGDNKSSPREWDDRDGAVSSRSLHSEQAPALPGEAERQGGMAVLAVELPALPFHKTGSHRSLTVEDMRSEREAELTHNYQKQSSILSSLESSIDDRTPAYRSAGTDALRFCGLLPWHLDCDAEEYSPAPWQRACNTLWQKCVLCLAVASCGALAWLTVSVWHEASETGNAGLRVSLLFDTILSLASTACLLQIVVIRRMLLFRAHALLLIYAYNHWFINIWERTSFRSLCFTCVLITCVAFGRARVLLFGGVGHPGGALGFGASLVGVVVFMGLEFYILRVCHALATMIDCFSVEFSQHQNVGTAIHEWNIIQATLRQVCAAVQWIFLVMQVTVAAAVTTSAMAAFQSSSLNDPSVLPGVVVAVSVTNVFFRAATVTEKCERLTRFINSITLSPKEIDRDRQYIVDYINNSGAGFYFFNVRLTSQMAMKIMYVSGAAVFYVATRVMAVL